MRKFTTTICLLFIVGFVAAQNTNKYSRIQPESFLENTNHLFSSNISNQNKTFKKSGNAPTRATISGQQIGTAGNAFSTLQAECNQLAVNDSLNTVLFIHRNDKTQYGWTIGQYRYAISKDRGLNFNANIGVLNPGANNIAGGFNTRYPQAAIYNTIGNTDADNAWLVYTGSWHNGGSDASNTIWDGIVNGVMRLNGDTLTRTERNDSLNNKRVGISASLVNGLPGEFWATDNEAGSSTNDSMVIVYKGIWDTITNDIAWSVFAKLNPNWFTTGGTFKLTPLISFDPTGMKGWIGSCADYGDGAYRPYFYKTIDGGATWQGPIIVDLGQYSNISALLNPSGTLIPNMGFDLDLGVDANGDPHLVGALGSGETHFGNPYDDNNLFEITYSNADAAWKAVRLDTLFAFRGNVGTTSAGNYSQDNRPQVSTTADGSKVFFLWSDDKANADNAAPDLFGIGYDVVSKKYTRTFNFSGGDFTWDHSCTFPSVSPTCFKDASSSTIPVVIT
ncbi:MAG: hypothetical protein WCJ33_09365, partial [Pseudomonadota bacterium]